MASVDIAERADAFKEQANKYFKDGDYDKAIEEYTKAIETKESAVYFSNRSLAYLRTECFGYALDDATRAIAIDSSYIKGYYRRATAYMALEKFKEALGDLETVMRMAPNDKRTRAKLVECQKIYRRRLFEQAIAVEEKASALETFDPSSVTVEPSYDGPHLEVDESGKYSVTESFMLALMEHYKAQKKLHRKYAIIILRDVYHYIRSLPSLVEIDVPDDTKFTVCGDVHGQFYDLMNIFDLNGLPSKENPYLFNGDFVDRGSFSVECIFTLFGFKLLYPDHFYLSRGNHESENMNRLYGFEGEVKSKYSMEMVEIFTDLFNWLPLAHLINDRILHFAESVRQSFEYIFFMRRMLCNDQHLKLVMHGGLFSDDSVTLNDIKKISRDRQPVEGSPMCELLWSDPMESNGRTTSKRGIGCQFGPDVTERFCKANGLDYIIRSHEVKDNGYELAHNDRCVTVFSAPNYCDTMHNRGAFITLIGKHKPEPMKPSFTVFSEVPHPDVRPMAYASPFLSLFM
ncbi:Serine/threonine-protein phosphatase [Fasciolopsis buskii]|uniref:protein-serine/threonine phosphatase n=1 Tax=Fasciolopsis buskii TaxID=27845 RepID=A0A8E0RLI6_9TREM|nr:Serine/threonine-protein phosphatase [Fasciolopsis buski]